MRSQPGSAKKILVGPYAVFSGWLNGRTAGGPGSRSLKKVLTDKRFLAGAVKTSRNKQLHRHALIVGPPHVSHDPPRKACRRPCGHCARGLVNDLPDDAALHHGCLPLWRTIQRRRRWSPEASGQALSIAEMNATWEIAGAGQSPTDDLHWKMRKASPRVRGLGLAVSAANQISLSQNARCWPGTCEAAACSRVCPQFASLGHSFLVRCFQVHFHPCGVLSCSFVPSTTGHYIMQRLNASG